MTTIMTLQKMESHWTDDHILFDVDTEEFIAYDEAGLEHSRWSTMNQARDALVVYTAVHLGQASVDYKLPNHEVSK